MLKRPQTSASSVPAKKQKTNPKTVGGLRWYYAEKEVPPLPEAKILFARDEQGSRSVFKMFCSSTWAEIYPKIVHGYNAKNYQPYYEPRRPDKPVVLFFDIDEKVDKEEDHNRQKYLKQFQEGLKTLGIKEAMVVQSACGRKDGKYKTSYHITVPGVHFDSLKHLKAWIQQHTDSKQVVKQNKNGDGYNKNIYKIGGIEIDDIYHKGWWRMPMCAKYKCTRVLDLEGFEGRPLGLKQFKELSIHHIPKPSRKIEQQLNISKPRSTRARHLNSLKAITNRGSKMSNVDKNRFGLKGEFVLDVRNENGDRYKAISDEWQCPNKTHRNNRCVVISDWGLFCLGCTTTWPFVDPDSSTEEWCNRAKEVIFDVLRDTKLAPYVGDKLPEDTELPRSKLHWLEPEIKQFLANFFHSNNIGQKKQEYLNSITFTANGKYEMRHQTHGRLVFEPAAMY